MSIQLENPDEIFNWDSKQLWNAFKQLYEDGDIESDVYKQVKFGIKFLNVPIWFITNDWVEILPSGKYVNIMGIGKFDLNEYMEEKEKREELMRRFIYENCEKEDILKPR